MFLELQFRLYVAYFLLMDSKEDGQVRELMSLKRLPFSFCFLNVHLYLIEGWWCTMWDYTEADSEGAR